MKFRIFIVLIICFFSSEGFGQLPSKLDYQHKKPNRIFKHAFNSYLVRFFNDDFMGNQTYNDFFRNEVLKRIGEDSLAGADNIYTIAHKLDSLVFSDINSIKFVNDSEVNILATYYIKNYNIPPHVKNNSFIRTENGERTNTLIKVYKDTNNMKYYKQWYIDHAIVLHDSVIKSIKVVNSNIWYNSDKKRNILIVKYYAYRFGLAVEGASAGTALFIWVIKTYVNLKE